MSRNDPCWCGSGNKWKKCHYPDPGPMAEQRRLKEKYAHHYGILLKSPEQIDGIRKAGHLAANVLDKICAMAKEGVTTLELNTYAMELHKEAGAIPAPLGYGQPPFPKAICTSLNEVICHGIPEQRALEDGDILNIDVTVILNGYFGDCSQMVTIGSVSPEKQLVVDVAYNCLMESIAILKPGVPLRAIGDVIEPIAHKNNCSVVRQFVGHGVGVEFHENPQVAHNLNHNDTRLAAGMTFTIEPMINAGTHEGVIDPNDHWTARTKDGKASGQWEHTLLITEDGCEILTPWERKT
jgi:methionyl aminopeptidase